MSVKIAEFFAELKAKDSLNPALKSAKSGLEGISKEILKPITQMFTLTGLTVAAGKAYKATVGEAVSYASTVRNIMLISGESAQSTSKLIQVTEDYKLSSDNLMTAQRMLAKSGYSLNIETLARLSDAYLKLEPGMERQLFLTDKFGRSGAVFAELMDQGSSAILKRGDMVARGLILDQKALNQTRQYEFVLEEFSDTFKSIQTQVGLALLPGVTKKLEGALGGITGLQNMPEVSKNMDKLHKQILLGADSYEDYKTQFKSFINSLDAGEKALLFIYSRVTPYTKEWYDNFRMLGDGVNRSADELARAAAWTRNYGDAAKQTEQDIEQAKVTTQLYTAILGTTENAMNALAMQTLQTQLSQDGLFDSMDAEKVVRFGYAIGELTGTQMKQMAANINFQRLVDDWMKANPDTEITADIIVNLKAQANKAAGIDLGNIDDWVYAGLGWEKRQDPDGTYSYRQTVEAVTEVETKVETTTPIQPETLPNITEQVNLLPPSMTRTYNLNMQVDPAALRNFSLANGTVDEVPDSFSRTFDLKLLLTGDWWKIFSFLGIKPPEGKAAGGPASGLFLAGDAPGGGFTPFTEAIYAPGGAYVVNASDTRALFGDASIRGYAAGSTSLSELKTKTVPPGITNVTGYFKEGYLPPTTQLQTYSENLANESASFAATVAGQQTVAVIQQVMEPMTNAQQSTASSQAQLALVTQQGNQAIESAIKEMNDSISSQLVNLGADIVSAVVKG